MKIKRLLCVLLVLSVLAVSFTAFSACEDTEDTPAGADGANGGESGGDASGEEVLQTTDEPGGASPKYIFMFIADGFSFAHFSVTSAYLGALEGVVEKRDLNLMKFPVVGSAATYDLTSFAPDSSSTASAYASGIKTHSGVVNMDGDKKIPYETITEKLKKQFGYKIGIVSTVNLNHATPAAFYGHQPSRNNYMALTDELIASDFDYFAGGKLLDLRPDGHYEAMREKGYTVVTAADEYRALTGNEDKIFIASDDKESSDDTGAMHYEIDRPEGQPSIYDYVKTGIDFLSKDNDTGFFFMVEGGKVDWASHANDAASVINDVLAFDRALALAVEFYEKHPDDTLIIVTGDHETGGLSIGFAGTGYDTNLEILASQKMSFIEYNKRVEQFRANETSFDEVMRDIKLNFGLMARDDPDAGTNRKLVLSAFELETLEAAYEMSMLPSGRRRLGEGERILYGDYEPLSVTLTHVLNQKAGIGWSSYSHTGMPVPVFALGAGQELFTGFYENTDIFLKFKALTGVE